MRGRDHPVRGIDGRAAGLVKIAQSVRPSVVPGTVCDRSNAANQTRRRLAFSPQVRAGLESGLPAVGAMPRDRPQLMAGRALLW